jgi:hypothetical protein
LVVGDCLVDTDFCARLDPKRRVDDGPQKTNAMMSTRLPPRMHAFLINTALEFCRFFGAPGCVMNS